MKKIRVGLIGCGFMGKMHADCYRAIGNAELAAVADLRPDCAEKAAAGSAAIYRDGKDLLDNEKLDAVDICLPTYLHTKYALMAMEKAKYVFIEKPVALTAAECEALMKKSRETGCQVQVGQVIRFWDEYVKLREFIESGIYGPVSHASFKRISPRPMWGWEGWLLDFDRSGGAGQDLFIHDLDYALSVFGKPLECHSVRSRRGEKNSFTDMQLRYKDFCVNLESTWDLPGAYHFSAGFRVVFEKATVELAGGKFTLYDGNGAGDIVMEKEELGTSDSGGNISDLGGYYKELNYFVKRAASGEPVEEARLSDAVDSLLFLLDDMAKDPDLNAD